MRLNILCTCLLLLAAGQAHPEGSWKWESSDKSAPSTEAPATTTPQTNTFRYTGQAASQSYEEDSLKLTVAGKLF